MEAFNKELAKLLFKIMDAQELQDSEKVSAIWVKSLNSIVNKMNNTKSSMIDMKPRDAIKLDTVKLDRNTVKHIQKKTRYMKMVYKDIHINLVNISTWRPKDRSDRLYLEQKYV